jgi:coproporphyrinogen III oxidase-like Fe-S oxidoreductase
MHALDKRKWSTWFETDIPKDQRKKKTIQVGKELLLKNGYHEIGMDHFETVFVHCF